MKESGNYPPGCEFHPDAPWNQVEKLDPDEVKTIHSMACELFDSLKALKDSDSSWFGHRQALSSSLADAQKIIDGLDTVYEELLGD